MSAALPVIHRDERFSDAVIICGSTEFKVHKVVVCNRSEYFSKVFEGQFKEAQSARLELPDEDPEAVSLMLDFLYTGEYTIPENTSRNECLLHAQFYAAGEKYSIPQLRTVAQEQFSTAMAKVTPDQWKTTFPVVDVAVQIYNNTSSEDMGIRKPFLNYVMKYPLELLDRPEVSKLLQDVNDFARDCIKLLIERPPNIFDVFVKRDDIKSVYCWQCLVYTSFNISCMYCYGRDITLSTKPPQ